MYNLDLARRLLQDKTVAIFLTGRSLEKLEKVKERLANSTALFIGLNKVMLIDKYILYPINRRFDILTVFSEVRFKEINPFIIEYLIMNKQTFFFCGANTFKFAKDIEENFCYAYRNRMVRFGDPNIGNSLIVLLWHLANVGTKKAVLFGCDGTGESTDPSKVYYRQEELMENGEARKQSIHKDIKDLETLIEQYKPQLDKLEILNANLESKVPFFKKISLEEALNEIS